MSTIAQCAERTGHATPMSIPVGCMFLYFVKLRIQSSVRLNIKGTTAQKDTLTSRTATRAQRCLCPRIAFPVSSCAVFSCMNGLCQKSTAHQAALARRFD
ncbi:unnamed protein product [Ixodes persulcatus]